MKKIKLTQGKFALVDDEDYEYLNQFNWMYNHGYAVRNPTIENPYRYMHRYIMKTPKGYDTDHIDSNRLNNQKSNLRVCSAMRNQQNRKAHSDNTSGYKGVNRHGIGWMAQIMCKGKQYYLGTFKVKEDAARAYDKKAVELHGEFAVLNFPQETTE